MKTRTVVTFEPNERRDVILALTQLDLAFPRRLDDGDPQAAEWQLLRRMSHAETQFDAASLWEIQRVLERANAYLEAHTNDQAWRDEGVDLEAPGSAAASPEVLAESARLALAVGRRLAALVDVAFSAVTRAEALA